MFGNITIGNAVTYFMAIGFLLTLLYKLSDILRQIYKKIEEHQNVIDLTYQNTKNIEKLTSVISEEGKVTADYRRRMMSDALFKCYNRAKEQGFITRRQLENFQANVQLYRQLKGNGIVEKKYIPEILKMEVRE